MQPDDEVDSESRLFVPLLNGDESEASVQLRYKAYQELWAAQEEKIQVMQAQLIYRVFTMLIAG